MGQLVSSVLLFKWIFLNNFNYLWKPKGLNFNQIKAHDNGIVLSGMFEYNEDLNRLVAKHSPDRIWQTIQLYKAKDKNHRSLWRQWIYTKK